MRGTRSFRGIRCLATGLAAAAIAALLTSTGAAHERPIGPYERVSTATGGGEWPYESGALVGTFTRPALSADGRWVAFASLAEGEGPLKGVNDIYVKDRKTGKTQLVSVPSTGLIDQIESQLPGTSTGSIDPVLSANGRFVVFYSDAPYLAEDDGNLCLGYVLPGSCPDIFVHDRVRGRTERVSVTTTGEEKNFPALRLPDISANGRYVTFATYAGLVPGDDDQECQEPLLPIAFLPTCDSSDVYVHDRKTKQLELVSVSSDGSQGNGSSQNAAISGDGRFVAFTSRSDNLVDAPGACVNNDPSQNCPQVYVHDRKTGKTELVSLGVDGQVGNYTSQWGAPVDARVSISDSGRHVTFSSKATNLVPNDNNGLPGGSLGGLDMFVRDLDADRTRRVSVSSAGMERQGGMGVMSADGRSITFNGEDEGCRTSAGSLCGGVLVHDYMTGALQPTMVAPDTTQWFSALDGSGRIVAALSGEPMVEEDRNGVYDVFVRDRGTELGVGSLIEGGSLRAVGANSFEETGTVVSLDPLTDVDAVQTRLGANLIGSTLVYRPDLKDFFVALELEDMPLGAGGAPSLIRHGMRFVAEGRSYEVRAGALGGGIFELFNCTGGPSCSKIADLSGGYGTTGERVVFSLPLEEVGLQDGGEISAIETYSALGPLWGPVTAVLDVVDLL